METINIKGKKYVTVNERLKAFRTQKEFAGWTLKTIAHALTDDVAVMEAQIIDKDGRLIANGFAREVRTQAGSMVNATSYVENCETSAWGRALGNLGIGIDEAICSAQELLVAIGMDKSKQAEPAPAAPVVNKGGAIYPAKEEAPKTQKNGKQTDLEKLYDSLSDREFTEYNEAIKQMNAATTYAGALDIWKRYREAKFAALLVDHGIKLKAERGWV